MAKIRPVEEITKAAKNQSIKGALKNGVAGVVIGIFSAVIAGIVSVGELLVKPLNALGNALEKVVVAFIIEPLQIVVQGATTSTLALKPGASFDLGPFTWLAGLGVLLAGAWILDQYLEEGESSNVVPFAPFDIPIPFLRDEDDP